MDKLFEMPIFVFLSCAFDRVLISGDMFRVQFRSLVTNVLVSGGGVVWADERSCVCVRTNGCHCEAVPILLHNRGMSAYVLTRRIQPYGLAICDGDVAQQ